ncbi:hypothetical protein PS623_01452 [Pseudomonas fluorescens]|nr:hypothetical protein PS623_01452 [Pseudomonas fluorescens]
MSGLSNVFKYISHFRHAGHQVGRKVGDMLEVLTYAAIARDDQLLSRLQVEPKLHGFSDAGHKVEFVLLKRPNLGPTGQPIIRSGGEITDLTDVIGFVECKKVGVEQTVNGSFKKAFTQHGNTKYYKVPFDHSFRIAFSPRGGLKHNYRVLFTQSGMIQVRKEEDLSLVLEEPVTPDHRLIFTLCENNSSQVIGNNESLRIYDLNLKNARILEVQSLNAEGAIALLNDCLPGPQTPEKAKQAAFVALDVRKRRLNSFDKRANEEELVSILVLTEFSHWETKSQNMIKACIDVNLIVDDKLIIEAFTLFEEKFGSGFYAQISKDNYLKDAAVKAAAFELVEKYNGKIFRDLSDGIFKSITYNGGRITLTS